MPGTLKDEWRALGTGHLAVRNSMTGTSREDSFTRDPETYVNPLYAKLNPICHLLALLGAHPILHISRIRVKQGS